MTALTVHNAEVKTAAVEIKALTVSGKQVTLAVFRQLREEPLISVDGTFNGDPWGVVNYHPDKCADGNEHWHVVWQHGSDLLRCRVNHVPDFARAKHYVHGDACDQFYTACVWAELAGQGAPYFGGKPIRTVKNLGDTHPLKEIEGREHGVPVAWEMSPTAFDAAKVAESLHGLRKEVAENRAKIAKYEQASEPVPHWLQIHQAPQRLAAAEARLPGLLAQIREEELPEGRTLDDLYQAFDDEVKREAERRERHRDRLKDLADLPQLFIAV